MALLDGKAAACGVAGASCLATLWLADPLLLRRTVALVSDPPGVLLSLAALAQIAALGALAPLSVRALPLCARSEDMWREAARGLLLGLGAHGAGALASGVHSYLALLAG